MCFSWAQLFWESNPSIQQMSLFIILNIIIDMELQRRIRAKSIPQEF